eukprot:SAG11_NODE_35842_length_264_cov_1.830303_1_plen_23_part_10
MTEIFQIFSLTARIIIPKPITNQ